MFHLQKESLINLPQAPLCRLRGLGTEKNKKELQKQIRATVSHSELESPEATSTLNPIHIGFVSILDLVKTKTSLFSP